MNNPESPEQRASLPEARIMWAASFLTDWIIPLIEADRIDSAEDIIRLREEFPPKEEKGTDFTLQDVLVAAFRWRAYNQKLDPNMPEDSLPDGEALHRAIDLLSIIPKNPSQSEDEE